MQEETIIIAGFGRSGTTWLSDILSKALGGLILFEPFHPCVFSKAQEYCYDPNLQNTRVIEEHLGKCYGVTPENLWLLRNHLPSDPDLITSSYVNYIWKNANILGFKTLRLNHCLNNLNRITKSKSIYIIRNPFAVLCSINNRPNFWKEFGWEWHKKTFFKRALSSSHFNDEKRSKLLHLLKGLASEDEYVILMWCISIIIGLNEVLLSHGHIVCYEDLYLDPYYEINKILSFLDCEKKSSLHPSYFFTPSMTSLSTIHHGSEMENFSKSHLDDFFWKNKLESRLVEKMNYIINNCLSENNAAMQFVQQYGYLT